MNNKTIILGWFLFIVCLLLPATSELDYKSLLPEANESYIVFKGYEVAMMVLHFIPITFSSSGWALGTIAAISNIAAILSILVIFIKDTQLLSTFGVIYLLFGLNNLFFLFMSTKEIGVYVWIISFFIIAFGLFNYAMNLKHNKSLYSTIINTIKKSYIKFKYAGINK